MLLKPNTIILDLDGPLLDISERSVYAQYEALRHLGYDVSLTDIKQHHRVASSLLGIIKALDITMTETELEDYIRACFTSFNERTNFKKLTKLLPRVAEVLNGFTQRYQLILVTSRNSLSLVEEELEWFKLKHLFSLIVTREVAAKFYEVEEIPILPFQEQRTQLYDCVLELTQLNPREILCVGDSVDELEPAKRLHMITIGVLTGLSTKEELEKTADYVVHDLREIPPILS